MDWHLAFTVGLLLSAALVAGLLAERVRLPKVTAYLLLGLLLGPAVLDRMPEEHLEELEPLTKLAMALVLFNLGCSLPLAQIRRILKRIFPLSAGEMGLTMAFVTLGLPLFGASWQAALLLGALALATAPATTLLVLKEAESEGPVTRHVGPLVAANNFVAIVLFELVFLLVSLMQGSLEGSVVNALGKIVADVVGSLLLGAVAGLILSYLCSIVSRGRWIVLLIGSLMLVLGACQTFGMQYMLAFLAMGIVVANSSDLTTEIVGTLDRLTGFLCVVFFVVHGAHLDLHAFAQVGWIGAGYIVLRSAGKYLGIHAIATSRGEDEGIRMWLGSTLVAQAGAAIALAAIAVERNPELGTYIQNIVLGTVVFFEIAGPIMIRLSVIRAGEVPLAHVIHHTSANPIEELRALWSRLLVSLGYDPLTDRGEEELTVQHLMRKTVKGIAETATFTEVVAYIEQSHDDTYFLVDDEQLLSGIIRYRDLSKVLFDPTVGSLVRADDLATEPKLILQSDEPLARARGLMNQSRDDCFPVLSAEEPHRFEGIVRRKDLVRLYLKAHGSEEASGH
jgi:Kef-type K+ transport system membrane component KefB